MDDGELIETMIAARRSASRLQAVELAAVAELARRRDTEEKLSGAGVICASDYVNDEVAAALMLTAASADDLIRFATELTGRLPATFSALADGDLDYSRARTVWHQMTQVSDDLLEEIETRVLSRAADQTTGQIRAKIRRLLKRLDPDTLTRRRQHAERQRDVQLTETDDGTTHLTGLDLPTDAATAAYNRLNAIAAGLRSDGDRRAIGQLRADVFLGLLSGTLKTGEPPADNTRLQATATPAPSEDGWSGADDAVADAIAHAARTQLTTLPGQLRPDAVAERHQRLARLITQAGERIADSLTELKTPWCLPASVPEPAHGHRGYRVPTGMRRLIEKRDRRCGFPGCRRPVRHCDADHTIPYHRNGPTCPCNIAMLCRHHHTLKQTPGWRLQHLWPGVLLWTSPTGHWRITAPADRE